MALSNLALLSAMLLAPSAVLGDTVLGLAVFSRHGDRTSKHYSGYTLTNLGAQQNYKVGADYRSTYVAANSPRRILGIAEDKYAPSQIYASAPDQAVLLNTATAFLQGLYPPLRGLESGGGSPGITSQTLNNGSSFSAPLEGYQYVTLHGESDDSRDTIWIKGDEQCPAATTAQNSYKQSAQYQSLLSSTKGFYERLWPLVQSVYDYTPAKMSYANAYDIFDLVNVAAIQNTTAPPNVTDADLFQLRTLADAAEFGTSYNASQPARAIGGQTLLGAMLQQLNQTVAGKGKLKFSLLAGSYDTFQAVFGLTGLTALSDDFYGLPGYASTIAFELFTPANVTAFPASNADLQVRFLFRNGSDTALTAYPLFGRGQMSLSWADFVSEMQSRSVTSVTKWCDLCQSTTEFCVAAAASSSSKATPTPSVLVAGGSGGGSALSNAVAGVIGAMVTLGVIGIAGLAFFLLRRKRRAATPAAAAAAAAAPTTSSADAAEKGSIGSSGKSA